MDNSDSKIGLGIVALMAVCCLGPLILSLVASGAVLGGLAALWADGRLLVVPGAVLVAVTMWLLWRRRSSHADESCASSATRVPNGSTHPQAGSAAAIESDDWEADREQAPVLGQGALRQRLR